MLVSFGLGPAAPAAVDLHTRFLSVLPRIERYARTALSALSCPCAREDAVAEVVALAWSWYRRLTERGRDPSAFVSALTAYAVRQVRSGRRLCGQEKAKDVLSRRAQRRHGFAVHGLPDSRSPAAQVFAEALRDNTRTAVPEQVAFRLDFPAWRSELSRRRRAVVDALLTGASGKQVAERFGITPTRVSQLRRDFKQDWDAFCAEPADANGAAAHR
jgi:DNA-directed RNA polymerase specialized sigma24 family protein